MYKLRDVTTDSDKWSGQDPVRPELTNDFRMTMGREVYGLCNEDGKFDSFVCIAYVSELPSTTHDLNSMAQLDRMNIAVPYSVWSHKRGAGKEIIKQVSALLREAGVKRIITLSPQTTMARRFHLKNGAIELRINKTTTNFEYLR